MAAPVVSGTIALLMEHEAGLGFSLSLPSSYKATLLETAEDLGSIGPDYQFGYGKLNALAAVQFFEANNTCGTGTMIVEGIIAHSEEQEYVFQVLDASDQQVTLVWDDVEATAGASLALINDLDVEVEDPAGGTHQPWILDPLNPSVAATTGRDSLNNIEQVFIARIGAAGIGEWKVRVKGTAVPAGPQSFSLVSQQCLLSTPTGILASLPEQKTTLSHSPNPANATLTIRYTLSRPGPASVTIYDPSGRRVRTLLEHPHQGPGTYSVVWNGTNEAGEAVGSGVYFYKLGLATIDITRMLTIVR